MKKVKEILFYVLLGAVFMLALGVAAHNDQQVLTAQYNYPEVIDYK